MCVHAVLDSLEQTVKQILMIVRVVHVVMVGHVLMALHHISVHALLVILVPPVKQILMNVLLLHVFMGHVMMEFIPSSVTVLLDIRALFVLTRLYRPYVLPLHVKTVVHV